MQSLKHHGVIVGTDAPDAKPLPVEYWEQVRPGDQIYLQPDTLLLDGAGALEAGWYTVLAVGGHGERKLRVDGAQAGCRPHLWRMTAHRYWKVA